VLILQADGDAILDTPGNATLWSTNTSKQTYAVVQLPAHGWEPDQFGCLNSIWVRESGWNERAGHPRRPPTGSRRYYGPLLAGVLGTD
jgi:hypothetical protein